MPSVLSKLLKLSFVAFVAFVPFTNSANRQNQINDYSRNILLHFHRSMQNVPLQNAVNGRRLLTDPTLLLFVRDSFGSSIAIDLPSMATVGDLKRQIIQHFNHLDIQSADDITFLFAEETVPFNDGTPLADLGIGMEAAVQFEVVNWRQMAEERGIDDANHKKKLMEYLRQGIDGEKEVQIILRVWPEIAEWRRTGHIPEAMRCPKLTPRSFKLLIDAGFYVDPISFLKAVESRELNVEIIRVFIENGAKVLPDSQDGRHQPLYVAAHKMKIIKRNAVEVKEKLKEVIALMETECEHLRLDPTIVSLAKRGVSPSPKFLVEDWERLTKEVTDEAERHELIRLFDSVRGKAAGKMIDPKSGAIANAVAENWDLRSLQMLVDAGFAVDVDGFFPLHTAVTQGNVDTIRFLFHHGAAKNTRRRACYRGPQNTPLQLARQLFSDGSADVATKQKFGEIICLLTDAEQLIEDINHHIIRNGGTTNSFVWELQCAMFGFTSTEQQRYLATIFRSHAIDPFEDRPIIATAIYNHWDLASIKGLTHAGFSVDTAAGHPWPRTPLYLAVDQGNVDLVDLLLRKGASRERVSGEEQWTAEQLARWILNDERWQMPQYQETYRRIIDLLNPHDGMPDLVEAEAEGEAEDIKWEGGGVGTN